MAFIEDLLGIKPATVNQVADHATVADEAALKARFTKHTGVSTGLTVWDDATDRFSGTRKADNILTEIKHHMDASDKFKEHLDDVLGDTASKDRSIDRLVRGMDRKSAAQAKSVYSAVEKGVAKHTKAKAALIEESAKLQIDLGKKHLAISTKLAGKVAEMKGAGTAALSSITDIGGIKFASGTTVAQLEDAAKHLEDNFDNARNELSKKVNEQLEKHTGTIEEMQALATKVEEQTGIKRSIKTAASELKTEAKAEATAENVAGDIKPNGPNKLVEGIKVGLGLGMVYDGMTNEDRTGAMKAGEITIGALLSGHGALKLLRKVEQTANHLVK